MKIDPNSINRPQLDSLNSVKTPRPPETTTPTGAVATGGGADKAEFSARAQDLKKARAALEEVPEIRLDQVAILRQQVANGTYKVPHDELALKLLTQK